MSFTWSFNLKFQEEFQRYPLDQRKSIVNFLDLYEKHGLKGDWSVYPGKMSQSWRGLLSEHPNYRYTKDNFLYHYHIGIPDYRPSANALARYQTSDYLLHFQWEGGEHIHLVDTCAHHRWTGEFQLPAPEYLDRQKAAPELQMAADAAGDSQAV
ncbi:hypothetical protein [Delftia lacustris]|uniref:hypothetical protein n=1 Tax=Delftia TaxID=80865 RepID=UPI0018E812B9|nr:hypothetical protein [Delftia lacustris]